MFVEHVAKILTIETTDFFYEDEYFYSNFFSNLSQKI